MSLSSTAKTMPNVQRFRILLGIVTVLFATAAFTFAQGVRGNISGTVTDPSGALVSGANVKLVRNDSQLEVRTVQSNEDGVYQLLEIEPLNYDIIITATGFAESRLRNVSVEPNRSLRLDTQLTITGATVEVMVTAGQELLDRESGTLGTTVDPLRVQGLPLNGRNILDLALGQPGVQTGGGGSGIRVNGSRSTENNIQLDGSNNNEVAVGGTAGVNPRPDAVQEFRLLTSNFEAEFGRNSGSVINVVTKGGTNDYHGNARIFYRPTFLSAARFFDQNNGNDPALRNKHTCPVAIADRTRENCDRRRPFERKEFGGNIGGPIRLPRFGEGGASTYSGKDHAFFFVDYEGRRQLIGDSRTITNLPTVEERQGIFTRLASNPLMDPVTNTPFPIISTAGTQIRQQIPQARFTPIAAYYLGFLPTADAAGSASVSANELENFDIITARVDPWVSEKQAFGVTFNYFDRLVFSPFAFGGASVPGFPSADPRKTYNAVFRHTFNFSPTVVNSLLIGYARNEQAAAAPENVDSPAQIGFTANFVSAQQFAGPPMVRLFDRNILIGNSIQGPQARVSENWQLQDSLSWAKGNHRFKFGFDGTDYNQQTDFVFINQGLISMSGRFGGNTSGDDLADLLLGIPNFVQFGAAGDRDFKQLGTAMFAQDTWRVSNSLTLSLGLRHEYVGPLYDKYNRVAYYRPNAAAQGIGSTLLAAGQVRTFEGVTIPVGAGLRPPTGLLFVGDPDPDLGGTVPQGGINKDKNNFAPRFGFAYSPRGKSGFLNSFLGDQESVIRGGFGVFYGAIIGDTALQQLTAPGYQGTNAFFAEMAGTLADPFAADPFPLRNGVQPTIPNPFATASAPVVGVSPVTRTTGATIRLSQLSRAIDPHIRTPYTYQYNVTFERGFRKDYVASLSYVGSRGRKLYAIEELNPAYGTVFMPYPSFIPAAQQFGANNQTGNINARRTNTDYALGISQQVAAGNSWYNSLQANLQRRFSNGLLFQVSYTLSKSETDTGGTDTNRGTLDRFDRSFNKALSSDDVPHRFVGSFVYDLPFFKQSGNFANTILGGWSIGGIVTFESGRPFSVGNLDNTTGTGGGILGLADIGAPYENLDPRENAEREFNPEAFLNAACPSTASATAFALCNRRGTSRVNQFRANNGVNNVDLILSKKTRLWSESSNLELRFEAFNAFNHTQFTTLNTNLNNIVRFASGAIDPARTAFGKFTAAREARVIQLGARISF